MSKEFYPDIPSDLFSSHTEGQGRKKSKEWNDQVADEFQKRLTEKIKSGRKYDKDVRVFLGGTPKKRKKTVRKTGVYRVYVIEIDNNPKWLYVGQTAHEVEHRFNQHMSGKLEQQAAKIFRKGMSGRLRKELYQVYRPLTTRLLAERLEASLALKLQDQGYTVISDGLKKFKSKKSKYNLIIKENRA